MTRDAIEPTPAGRFPGGHRFAFTVIDDTDGGTVETLKPVYDVLSEYGFRTTKTVWPVSCPEGSAHFGRSKTLEDDDYREFILKLKSQGFEIALHGATMESSRRARTERAFEYYREVLGDHPRIHVNHSRNRDNIYWGTDRVDEPIVRLLYGLLSKDRHSFFSGHREGSEWFWGDLCRERIEYVRNLTYTGVNLMSVNPSMPYVDLSRPYVRWWFSSSDADDREAFNHLLRESEQERLEREGGVCIITTHFAKGFAWNGSLDGRTEQLLRALSRRNGWFVPVGELLDFLREQRSGEELPDREWRRMQWTWIRQLIARHARRLMATLPRARRT